VELGGEGLAGQSEGQKKRSQGGGFVTFFAEKSREKAEIHWRRVLIGGRVRRTGPGKEGTGGRGREVRQIILGTSKPRFFTYLSERGGKEKKSQILIRHYSWLQRKQKKGLRKRTQKTVRWHDPSQSENVNFKTRIGREYSLSHNRGKKKKGFISLFGIHSRGG